MNFSIDIAIVASFLVINLIFGLYFGRGTKTIKDYAIGNRNFSTATLSATIIATWISGDFFTVAVSDTYKEGLWFAFAGAGDIVALLIIGCILGPRMREFFGSLSVAEVMGNIFGQKIRIVTAIASIAHAVGVTSLQIKVFSTIFSHFLGLSSIYATLISSFVVIFYATFGGIRAVTFTDVIQFFTFGVFIPIFALFVWQIFGSVELVLTTFQTNKLFDFNEIINYNNANFFPYLMLFLYCMVPSFNSTLFQRTLMAKDTEQIKQSFTIAGIVSLMIHIFSCFIGFVVLSNDPTLAPDNVAMYVVDNYSFIGLKGLAIIGIMAMIMSTADSWINTASVIFSHDLCKPLGLKFKDELKVSRVFAAFVGLISVLMTLSTLNISILQMYLLKANFYKPVVTVPLILAILGFRSSTKAVAIGMFTGGLWAILWKVNITPITGIDSVIPAMAMNLIAYMGSHYLLGERGGWIGVKKDIRLNETPKQKGHRYLLERISLSIAGNSSILEYFNSKAPKNDTIYLYFAFGALSSIITTFTLDKSTYAEYMFLINFLQGTSLLISMFFICRHFLWSENLKQKYVGLLWYISIFICLSLISSLLVFISEFSQVSLVLFILNLTMIGILLTWQDTLFMVLLGSIMALCIYQYTDLPTSSESYDLRLKVTFIVFIFSSFMLTFLKPKQEYIEETEHKAEVLEGENVKLSFEVTGLNSQVTDLNGQVNGLNNQLVTLNTKVEDLNEQVTHYIERTEDQQKEIDRLGKTSQKILNNVNHELRLPIGNVINFADMLHETLQKTENNKLLTELAKEVYDNSHRVSGMILNMLDLATLEVQKVDLEKTTVNLSELIVERVRRCQKIYLRGKDIEFKFAIESEIMISVDPNYIRQTVDNLVINAINFSEKGMITITVKKEAGKVIFTITDQGKGIPKNELFDIFNPFKMGSNSESKACGRGVGLALCKSAVQAHGGSIHADSDGVCGAKLQFTLPLNS